MLPYLQLFGKTLPTYGVLTVAGGAVGFLVILLLSYRRHCDFENLVYLYALGIVGALIGAKTVYVLTAIPEIWQLQPGILTDPGEWLSLFIRQYLLSGVSITGAFMGAIAAFSYWVRAFRVDRIQYAQVLAPAMPLYAFFLRLGCTAAGCCYGIPTSSRAHIRFRVSPVAPNGIPLLPTQPMEAAFHFLGFLYLLQLIIRQKRICRGVYQYIAAYGGYRFLSDFIRGDSQPMLFDQISMAQLAALGMIAFAFFLGRKCAGSSEAKAASASE